MSAAAEDLRHSIEQDQENLDWRSICMLQDLTPDAGVRALVGGGQIALFRVARTGELYAIDAIDPFTGAAVLSRGIVGDIDGEVVVASPIYKQHFSLTTGRCLEDDTKSVKAYPVRVVDGMVQLAGVFE